MLNLINAIGVLLLIGGFTCFILGAIPLIIPSFANLIPEEFKKVFTMQTGGLLVLVALVLLYLAN